MDDHPVEIFQKAIDSKKLRIINFPSFIFFCGGKCSEIDADYCSMRHYLYHHLRKKHDAVFKNLRLAETINDWYRGGHYNDLLTFEKDIAGLAEKIVIFVESPGSIAELGSFSQIDEIRDKLVVFISDAYFNKDSFIRNGPISFLLDKSNESVFTHPWKTYVGTDGNQRIVMDNIDEQASHISAEIIESLGANKHERSFRFTDSGHKLLLMADIIDVMYVSKKREIINVLQALDIADVNSFVDKYLFILQKVEIVKSIRYGNDDYYVRTKDSDPYIRYAYKDFQYSRDRLGWKIFFREWYKKNDTRRITATRTYLGK